MIHDSRLRNKKSRKSFFGFFDASCILHLESSRRGFTIVETLVAIAILLLSITAPLTIAERGLASAEVAKTEITAFYLGQEAVEYIRNARDTNALSGKGGGANWLQDMNECFKSSGCGIDVTQPIRGKQIVACNTSNEQCRLWQYTGDPGSPLFGIFGHRTVSGWNPTDMTRVVRITELRPGVEAEIAVTVVWNAGSLGSRTLTLRENILNWYVSK